MSKKEIPSKKRKFKKQQKNKRSGKKQTRHFHIPEQMGLVLLLIEHQTQMNRPKIPQIILFFRGQKALTNNNNKKKKIQ